MRKILASHLYTIWLTRLQRGNSDWPLGRKIERESTGKCTHQEKPMPCVLRTGKRHMELTAKSQRDTDRDTHIHRHTHTPARARARARKHECMHGRTRETDRQTDTLIIHVTSHFMPEENSAQILKYTGRAEIRQNIPGNG